MNIINKIKKITFIILTVVLIFSVFGYFYLTKSHNNGDGTLEHTNLKQGMVTFIFDDGHATFYDNAYPLFEEKGYHAAIAIDTARFALGRSDLMTTNEVLELQENGWEVMSHSVTHGNFDESARIRVSSELIVSKKYLELLGFDVKQYVAPMSTYPLDEHKDLLERFYDAGYTTYVNAREKPIEELVINGEFDKYEMYRANMEGKSIEELKEYIDYVDESDSWLVFYEHQIGGAEKYITSEKLSELLAYIETKGIKVVTGSEALNIINNSN